MKARTITSLFSGIWSQGEYITCLVGRGTLASVFLWPPKKCLLFTKSIPKPKGRVSYNMGQGKKKTGGLVWKQTSSLIVDQHRYHQRVSLPVNLSQASDCLYLKLTDFWTRVYLACCFLTPWGLIYRLELSLLPDTGSYPKSIYTWLTPLLLFIYLHLFALTSLTTYADYQIYLTFNVDKYYSF